VTLLASLATAAALTTFAVAALSKVRSSQAFVDFAVGLGELRLRGGLARAAAAATIAVELLLCVGLGAGITWWPAGRFALAGCAVVLASFTTIVVRASRSTRDFACRCFGSEDVTNIPLHVVTNLSLALLCVLGAVAPRHPSAAGTTVLGLGLGALVGAAIVASEVLLDTFRRDTPATAAGRSHSPEALELR
jgi:hypothetical protein